MPQNGYSHRKLNTDLYTIAINYLYRTTVHVRNSTYRATILSYVLVRVEKVKGGRDDSVALSPMTFTPTLRQQSVSRGGFREREQRARYRCTIIVEALTHDCSAYGTWPCISLARHSVTPIPLTLSSPFTETAFFRNLFSLSRDSILVSTINTITACVILFDDIKISVFETIVVYILMSPVLVLAIFLRKNIELLDNFMGIIVPQNNQMGWIRIRVTLCTKCSVNLLKYNTTVIW